VGESDVSCGVDALTLLEAYVETVAEAHAAERAGADRLELCGPGEGGLTPSRGLLTQTMAVTRVPVHVMVRPRTGGFVYSAAELRAMKEAILEAKRARVAGVVFGVLTKEGTLDLKVMRDLVAEARPLRVACHRAFDATPDADAALDQLIALGVDLVLTSGHAPTALEGVATLARHVKRASGRITILAGGTIRAQNVRQVVEASGVHEVHARATDTTVFAALAAATKTT
jgi:copper homeostasis protein